MSKPAASHQPVTTVILQRPREGEKERFEAWLKKIVPMAQSFEGHRGVSVIRPHHQEAAYTIVLHFSSEETLRGWLGSPQRIALVKKISPYLRTDEEISIQSGLEFWFTPSLNKVAPLSKQFLVTLSAIYPLTVIVPLLLAPLLSMPVLSSLLIAKFIVALVIVALMIYGIMPRYTKLVSSWLFKSW